uniref:NADH dehydrogenase subunit 4L n=1 Tax=Sogata hakonensis TaxID=871477 RepID=A0A7S4Z0Y1_9HEMI|nr:NADH dehydrogenase subunit 4L [Sogata hakonensis]
MSIFFFIFFFNLISLVLVRKHYLMVLMVLEMIFLNLFSLIYLYLNFFNYEGGFGLIYLILGVSESCMGLSLLVYLIRSVNFSYVDSFNLC